MWLNNSVAYTHMPKFNFEYLLPLLSKWRGTLCDDRRFPSRLLVLQSYKAEPERISTHETRLDRACRGGRVGRGGGSGARPELRRQHRATRRQHPQSHRSPRRRRRPELRPGDAPAPGAQPDRRPGPTLPVRRDVRLAGPRPELAALSAVLAGKL